MDIAEKPPTVLSLCTGYGGIERGLERVIGKISVLTHVEIEAFAIANLVNKMETEQMDPVPIWTDIKTFRPTFFRGFVDILTGGYPCQPFSAAGLRKGSDDPRHLWPYIKTIIRDCRPNWVFFENVEGHLSKGVAEVLSDLEEMAYRVECGVFSASEAGAPHQRKRVFILAHSSSIRPRDYLRSFRGEAWPAVLRQEDGSERSVWIDSTGSVVADSISLRELQPEGCLGEQREWPGHGSKNMAHSSSDGGKTRLSKQIKREKREARKLNHCCDQWPARPGELQYKWEEPRVVDTKDTERRRSGDQDDTRGRASEAGGPDGAHGPVRQTQPKLGRTVDGITDRVDRLRLLGNGVVPQVAEKAFRTLYKKLTTDII